MKENETKAAAMYHAAAPCHPTWDQLGDRTKAEWLRRVAQAVAASPTKKLPVSRFARYVK